MKGLKRSEPGIEKNDKLAVISEGGREGCDRFALRRPNPVQTGGILKNPPVNRIVLGV